MTRARRTLCALGIACVLGLGGIGASCSDHSKGGPTPQGTAPVAPPPAPPDRPKPDARLLVVTDLSGTLEPCGCTSDPLGGIDRMAALVHRLESDGVPAALVVTGDTFYGSVGHLAAVGGEMPEQELWKSEVVAKALGAMPATVVLPGSADAALGDARVRALMNTATGQSVEALAKDDTKTDNVTRRGPFVIATVRESPDGPFTAAELEKALAPTKEESGAITVVLAVGSRRFARDVASKTTGVDFVVNGGLGLEAPFVPVDAGGAYVLNDGRQGQGVLVVDLFLDGPRPFLDWSDWSMDTKRENVDARIHELEARIAAWKRDPKIAKADIAAQQTRLGELQRERAALRLPATVSQRAFNARWIRLDRTAAQDAAVTAQMKAYDHRVNEHNRVAYASRVPRPAPPGMPHFVGSKACATCHKAAFDWWRETKHGHAYKTLVDVEKQYNLSCVGCHVTGYELPGGSTVTHNLDGALVDVGCENCHGAGSAHIAEPSAADKVLRDTPEATCRSCHNSEHSDLFAFTAYRAMLMAPGHGMPLEAPSKPAKP